MKRILLALAFVCAFFSTASAQTTNVVGTKVVDNTGALLNSGQWCFGASCLTVTNGAFGGSVTDATATVTVVNSSSTVLLTVPSVSIAGAFFTWDNFVVPSNGVISGLGIPRIACT